MRHFLFPVSFPIDDPTNACGGRKSRFHAYPFPERVGYFRLGAVFEGKPESLCDVFKVFG